MAGLVVLIGLSGCIAGATGTAAPTGISGYWQGENPASSITIDSDGTFVAEGFSADWFDLELLNAPALSLSGVWQGPVVNTDFAWNSWQLRFLIQTVNGIEIPGTYLKVHIVEANHSQGVNLILRIVAGDPDSPEFIDFSKV